MKFANLHFGERIVYYPERMDKRSILKALGYLKFEEKIVSRLVKVENYNDYPPFFQYTTAHRVDSHVNFDLNANGLSFNEDEAKAKAVMETIERWVLFHSQESSPTYKCNNWDLSKGELIIPKRNIFSSNTSGTACGFDLLSTLHRAIYELIERDAFAIYYFNRLTPKKIIFEDLIELKQLTRLLRNYSFEIHLLDISLDIRVPICMCILEDKSGILPRFTIGIKAGDDPLKVAEGAILESLQSLVAIRKVSKQPKKSCPNQLKIMHYWMDKDPHIGLPFFFDTKTTTKLTPINKLEDCLFAAGISDIFYRIVYDSHGIFVIQAAIPELVRLPFGKVEFSKRNVSRLSAVPVKLGINKSFRKLEGLTLTPSPFL